MKHMIGRSLALVAIGLATTAFLPSEPIYSVHEDDPDMFYNDLLPYGDWIEAEPGMLVWRPRIAYADWQPYADGRWVWTRHGWYWLSNEPFGWAVFHYGRWSMHPRFGWVWYPGTVWGPAWVEWRYSDEYIGWAPLPPVAVFHVTFGIRFTRHWVAPVGSWCFVPYRFFGSIIHRDRILAHERVQRIITTTRRGRSTIIDRDVIVNRGVERDMVERRGSIRIDRYEVRSGARGEGIREGRIETYRPDMDRGRDDRLARPGQRDTRELKAPRTTDPRKEITRPERSGRDFQTPRERPDIRGRRVAPNIRKETGRTSAPTSRKPGSSSGRKRDN